MPEVWFAIPGELATLTGGYAYARRLLQALPSTGWSPHYLPLPGGFPNPALADLAAVCETFSHIPPGSLVIVDGLAFGALPKDLLQSFNLRYIALVHHPLADESGISDSDAQRFKASERAALSLAQAVVATSQHTAATLLRDYAVANQNLYVAQPGTDPASRASPQNASPKLLTVATLTYRKGHDVLLEALSMLKDLAWHSLLVGSQERDLHVTANVHKLIGHYNLQDRVSLCGELDGDNLGAAYAGADIFVLPSRHEGYGMVFAESLARGLPIVACTSGAVSDTVPRDAGLLVPPEDPVSLAKALRLLITDHALRQKTADAAWIHGQALPTWTETAAHIARALAQVAA